LRFSHYGGGDFSVQRAQSISDDYLMAYGYILGGQNFEELSEIEMPVEWQHTYLNI